MRLDTAAPLLALSTLVGLAGCVPTGGGSARSGGFDEPDEEQEDPTPAANPFGEAANCPTFETGTVTFAMPGSDRSIEVELPEVPEGAPVLFAWHWLGGTAAQTLDWMGVRSLADEGYVIIAPESSGLAFEWDFYEAGADNVDLALFDAVLPCLWEQFEVDEDRVYSTGMSAGGLMTTFMTMHRADVLAATAPFSGGAGRAAYTEPAEDLPVLVTWGGPGDSYGGYDFHAASLEFIGLLEADGHFTVACDHGGGHLPPDEAVEMLSRFLGDHRRGVESPWRDGLPEELPPWCE